MRRLLIVVSVAVAAFALVAIPSVASGADWSSGIEAKKVAPKAKIACSGTVSCCDSPIADRVQSRSLQARGAAVVKKIRRLCYEPPRLECGIWHYVGNGYWMFVPCRG